MYAYAHARARADARPYARANTTGKIHTNANSQDNQFILLEFSYPSACINLLLTAASAAAAATAATAADAAAAAAWHSPNTYDHDCARPYVYNNPSAAGNTTAGAAIARTKLALIIR